MEKMEQVELSFLVVEDHSVSFTDDELKKMGVVFIPDVDEVADAASFLTGDRIADVSELKSKELEMMPVGEMSTVWAIYRRELSKDFVRDLWSKNNFYSIKAEQEGESVKEVRRVYLREEFFEEDLAYYIDLYFLDGQLKDLSVEQVG